MTITTYGELLSLLDDMGFIAFGGRTGIPQSGGRHARGCLAYRARHRSLGMEAHAL